MTKATKRQLALVNTMVSERDVPEDFVEHMRELYRRGLFTKDLASSFLTMLDKCNDKNSVTADQRGLYKIDNRLVRVAVDRKGKAHVRVMHRNSNGELHYSSSVKIDVRKINDSTKIDLDMAQKFGRKYGVCCVCGRTLTDAHSRAAGIGPKCIDKL